MTTPSVLVLVLNYRTPGHAVEAARAALGEMAEIRGSVTVIDNNSEDGSYEALSRALAAELEDPDSRIRLIASPQNGGYGAGNNFGIRAGLPDGGRPDYVYILNPDARPGPGAILALLRHLEADPRAAVAGSFIYGPEDGPHITAFRFPSIASEFEAAARTGPISRLLSDKIVAEPIPETTRDVDWVSGASMMLRYIAFERIGFFDERFFLYYDETDLCRRVRDAGWSVCYVRESVVAHEGSVSTGMRTWSRVPRYWYESRQYYFAKHHGRAYAGAATVARLAGGAIHCARRLIERRPLLDPPRSFLDLALFSLSEGWRGVAPALEAKPVAPGGGRYPASASPAPVLE